MLGSDAATEAVKLKVCLVGDEGVGKTSLVRRFVLSEFDERYVQTVGAVVSKRIVFVGPIDGTTHAAHLLVWDILGRRDFSDRYREAYFGNAAGILAVCDLTRPDTLDALGNWLDGVRATVGDVPAIVLANKRDLWEHVRVSEDDLLAACESYGAPVLETSAVTGENVGTAFAKIAETGLRVALRTRKVEPRSARSETTPGPAVHAPRPP